MWRLWIVLILFVAGTNFGWAITSAEMQAAMDHRICPADATEVTFLNYDACGPQPKGASSGYLSCQNRVDSENNVIGAYNDFVRRCNQSKEASKSSPPAQTKPAASGTNNDLSSRLKAAQEKAKNADRINEQNKSSVSKLYNNEQAARQQAAEEAARAEEEAARRRAEAMRCHNESNRSSRQLRCCGSVQACISECLPLFDSSGRCVSSCSGDNSINTRGCYWQP